MRRLVFAIILLLATTIVAQAEERAAVLEVTYSGIEIMRVDTDSWLSLRNGSIAPVGTGDQIRTDATGRALIRFNDDSYILLLSNSLYTIERFDDDDDGVLTLHSQLQGVAVQQVADIGDFRLQTQQLTLTSAAGWFGVWSDDLSNDVVAVTTGSIQLDDAAGQAVTVQAGEGLRYQPDGSELVALAAPMNRARLIGVLDGCGGLVRTVTEFRGVLVRTGAGVSYFRRGLVDDGDYATLLSRTESGTWTRVQYGNGFGWIVTIAVEDDCDLPTVPDNSPEEFILRVLQPDNNEASILLPFYGRSDLDGWFYQYLEDDNNG